MAKSIAVKLAGESSSFVFTKLDRDKLYGHKERQVVDADGKRCSSAWLSTDGAALVPSGGLAMLYVDDTFATVERSALKAVDAQGQAMTTQPSTLGVEQDLTGPVPAQEVLDHAIHTVYQVQPEALGPTLDAGLTKGGIFRTVFSYRDDYQYQTLFLVRNDSGTFALIGTPTGFAMVRRELVPVAPTADDGDDLADDLDFTML